MSITRHEMRKISDENRGQPIISQAVVHGNVAYFAGITPDPSGTARFTAPMSRSKTTIKVFVYESGAVLWFGNKHGGRDRARRAAGPRRR